MNPFDRALRKAFDRPPTGGVTAPSPPGQTVAFETHSPVNASADEQRGWVVQLREPTPQRTIEPAWSWPALCRQILKETGAGFQKLADQLFCPEPGSPKTVAFTGPAADAGKTTIILTLAQFLSAQNFGRLLLIDLDLEQPRLAQALGFAPKFGVDDVAQGTVAPDVAQITLDRGRLAILPLVRPGKWSRYADDTCDNLRRLVLDLRDQYDLILLDAGDWHNASVVCNHTRAVDAVINVARCDNSQAQALTRQIDAWHRRHIEFLGDIETFTPTSVEQPVKGAA